MHVSNHIEREGEGWVFFVAHTFKLYLTISNQLFFFGSFLFCFDGVSGTPESSLVWAADSVYQLSHMFTDVSSCCDYFSKCDSLGGFGI